MKWLCWFLSHKWMFQKRWEFYPPKNDIFCDRCGVQSPESDFFNLIK
jgi:hypothetical protein